MNLTPLTPTQQAGRQALAQALALESAGNFYDAFPLLRRATELDPGCGRAWRHLGNLLRRMGELGDASVCFERAIAAGDDRELNEFFLSAIGIGEVVLAPPASFVAALFDQYAPRFDAHLMTELHYRGPQMLAGLVGQACFDTALDLGCGTGLCGQQFAPRCRALTGVDLSAQMLALAGQRQIYERLIRADLSDHLRSTQERHDLLLCCDALIYTGDLSGVFAGAARVLRPGGAFAFTVEACEADSGIDLLPSLRYAHSERYVRALAQAHGFELRGIDKGPLREEEQQAVDGLAVYLTRH